MPRTGINYNNVKTAALQLLARGGEPSVQKIREQLGTGSNTTIAEHLRAWLGLARRIKMLYVLQPSLLNKKHVLFDFLSDSAALHEHL